MTSFDLKTTVTKRYSVRTFNKKTVEKKQGKRFSAMQPLWITPSAHISAYSLSREKLPPTGKSWAPTEL